VLGTIASQDAVPGLIATLRDPVVGTASWACWALEQCGDQAALPAVQAYYARLLSLRGSGKLVQSAGDPDQLVAIAASCRLALGDPRVVPELSSGLLAENLDARKTAFAALKKKFGEDRGYDPEGTPSDRRAAAARWIK
jgi:HEAT repeat protein